MRAPLRTAQGFLDDLDRLASWLALSRMSLCPSTEDERSDDSFVNSDLEILDEVVVPDAKARLPKKRPAGGSLSKLNRKKAVSAAAQEPLQLISGGPAAKRWRAAWWRGALPPRWIRPNSTASLCV